MSDNVRCSIGIEKNEECNKKSFTSKTGLEDFCDIEESQQELIILRAELETKPRSICYHHKKYFAVRYESFQKCCCDPFEIHKLRDSNVKGKYFIILKLFFQCFNLQFNLQIICRDYTQTLFCCCFVLLYTQFTLLQNKLRIVELN